MHCIEAGAGIACQLTPCSHCLLKAFTLRSIGASLDVREGGLIGSNHTSARPGFDGHVAEGHASLHGEIAYSRAAELDHIACSYSGAQLANDGEGEILRCRFRGQFACDADMHRFRTFLQEALCGKDLLDLAGADAEG